MESKINIFDGFKNIGDFAICKVKEFDILNSSPSECQAFINELKEEIIELEKIKYTDL